MKVSVIIPVYNVSAYIERCVKSVMNQTYDDFECILVDDASPDDSVHKCEKMISTYHGSIRFRIIHHQYNRGLSAARNTGTNAATGDYILYIDSDDAITNDCVEKLMAPIVRDKTIEMVMGNVEWVSEGYPLPVRIPKMHDCIDIVSSESVRSCFFDRREINVFAWNKLIRKDFLNQHDLAFKEGIIWEDSLWSFYVMKHLSHLYMIKDITYTYYIRPMSIMRGTDLKTKRYHSGLIYYDISTHLTHGECDREIQFYLKRFCRNYIDSSKDELFKKTAKTFRQGLSVLRNPFSCILLYVTELLSRSVAGRLVFQLFYRFYCAVPLR